MTGFMRGKNFKKIYKKVLTTVYNGVIMNTEDKETQKNKGEIKMKKFEFEKKGFKFLIEVEGVSCIMKVDGLEINARPGQHPKAGWNYKTSSMDLAEKLFGKRTLQEIAIAHETAKEAYHLIREEEMKLNEAERSRELVFKVEEAVLDRDWGITSLVLVEQKELLSDEQREQVAELKELLGEMALFVGATKHINAEELPVKLGETYTLTEIMEMAKKTEKYQAKVEREIAKEERINEAKEEARATGKNVEIDRYTVDCNDPKEECSTDIITVYVTPEGKIETTRTHTY